MVNTCMSFDTDILMFLCFLFLDARDNICLELPTRLLYPRGLGKNAVFMKKHEVILQICKYSHVFIIVA